MARANPQWRYADGRPVLAVFSGPHAYISAAWYEEADVVPTWNYLAVHATGVFRAIHDRDALLTIVRDTVAFYEAGKPQPWQITGSAEYLDQMLRAIVGFRIELTGIEGKWKLGQNHTPERRGRVVEALREQGGEDAPAIAELMEQTYLR
jgi:transcriptional regulator